MFQVSLQVLFVDPLSLTLKSFNIDMPTLTTDVNRMGDRLWNLGLYKGNAYNNNQGLRSIETAKLFNEVDKIILSGESIKYLYKVV